MTAPARPLTGPLSRRRHWNNQVRRHASMTPDLVALRHLGRSVTWAELHERSTALAVALGRRGIAPGDRVLITMLNRPEYLESLLAITAAGGIAVPVNIRMSPGEAVYIATDVGAKAIITDETLSGTASATAADTDSIEFVVATDTPGAGHLAYEQCVAEYAGQRSDAIDVDVADDSTALILYTSGTTGRPKGAMITHSNLNAIAMAFMDSLSYRRGDVVSVAVPMFHIGGIAAILPQLYFGGVSVIHPLGDFDADRTLQTFQEEHTTWVFLVPAQWQALADAQLDRPRELDLRVACWGAAPASDALLRSMMKAFPNAETVAVFGQTESTGFACYLDGWHSLDKLGSVGVPTSSVEVKIVGEDMCEVASGEVGEILFRGPTVMSGYWQRPEANEEVFAGGWLHSGDLGRQDADGFFYIVDRKKDMIISGGENVYCAEVENAILDHSAVAEVAVIGRADERWGEVAVAIAVAHDGEQVVLDDLVEFLRPRLARYKHPKDLILVDQMPKNASNKIRKNVLREQYGGQDAGTRHDGVTARDDRHLGDATARDNECPMELKGIRWQTRSSNPCR
jgi:fatty-acyl-CoA synthase